MSSNEYGSLSPIWSRTVRGRDLDQHQRANNLIAEKSAAITKTAERQRLAA
jgi:hypothetical protein